MRALRSMGQLIPAQPLRDARESLAKGLAANEAERAAHLEAMRGVVGDPQLEKVHGWIHTNLIILDSKAQAILGLYSIALATLTIFYAAVGVDAPWYIVSLIIVTFVVIAWAVVPLARVSYVYWSTTKDYTEPERMLRDLLRIRDIRTRLVRISLLKGGLTLILFGLLLLWDILRRL